MAHLLIADIRPLSPWRVGNGSQAARLDALYRSDSLYSAVTQAMGRLGCLEEWLAATARAETGAAVRFGSLFPTVSGVRLVPPPRSVWPPASSAKVRWKSARYVPVGVVAQCVAGQQPDETAWVIDGESECLLAPEAASQGPPFQKVSRTVAPVDRVSGRTEAPELVTALEFSSEAGLWGLIGFRDEEAVSAWEARVKGALLLLGDSGFGGRRSMGFGQADVSFPDELLPDLFTAPEPAAEPANGTAHAYWLLSLYSPAAADQVDWTAGAYEIEERTGRIESAAAWGTEKKVARMIVEGSVLVAPGPLSGAAPDVAPDGFAHPVYRAGFALAFPLPTPEAA